MVPGTIFDQPDRWQKLELVQMMPTIERLARILRASSRRGSHSRGRTLSGWLSTCSTVLASRTYFSTISKSARSLKRCSRRGRTPNRRPAIRGKESRRSRGEAIDPRQRTVRLERNLLEKRGRDSRFMPWFPTAIDAPGQTPPSCGWRALTFWSTTAKRILNGSNRF